MYYAGTDILANTGMSATLIQKRGTNEYTLAIRSTEFQPVPLGGDRDRDVAGADLTGIFANGLALAQLAALEDYYAWLKASDSLPAGSTLNVTGYSLGGHLATVFTEIHASDADIAFRETVTFNGAGRGTWSAAVDPGEIVSYYQSVLATPELAAGLFNQLDQAQQALYGTAQAAALANQPMDPISVYQDSRHMWAQLAARLQFGLSGSSLFDQGSSDLRNGAAAKITQIYGKEYSPEWTGVANSGVHGPSTGVFVEAQPLIEQQYINNGGALDFGNGHALVLLVDSLALMRAYQTFDLTLSVDAMNALFAASSNRVAQSFPTATAEDDALENALDSLRGLLLGTEVEPTAFKPGAKGFGDSDSRNDFHDKLYELTTSASYAQWAGSVVLTPLAGMTAAEIVQAAQNDIAYRHAIRELAPFVVADAQALYESHNTSGQLDFYDPSSPGRSGMTSQFLTDRAAMLAFGLKANVDNVKAFATNQVTDQVRYMDLRQRADGSSADVLAYLTGGMPNFNGPNTRVVAFGTTGDDALQGRENRDQLYAGDGNDYLRGGLANDYLEGGSGLDVYQYNASTTLGLFNTDDGADTIFDSDGRGLLHYTYTPSSGGARSTVIADASVKVSDTEWLSADGKFNYQLQPGTQGQSDLVVTINGDAGGSITLKDFRDGDFGIALNQPHTRTFADPSSTLVGTEQNDPIAGTAASELILALAGADNVHAGAGDDSVEGGDGADSIHGEDGGDRLYGDAGRDSVYGGGSDDELYGGGDADIVEGDDGADRIAGEGASDVVAGGAGDDEVHSGDVAPLATALLLGETEAPTGSKGEWVDGGEGEDTVIAGPGNDQVMGGGGADLLVGGAGDDNLVGDASRTLVHVDNWLVTRQVITSGGSTLYQLEYNGDAQIAESANGAGDFIYGGAGADWVFAGAGGDFVDAGSGDDVAFGEAEADALAGGDGNDVLIGDNPGVVAEAGEGGDYLDGGAGDDLLFGNGGDDVLFGGPGRDTLVGGAGKDLYVIEKGEGEDTIYDVASGADDPEASVLVFGEGVSQAAIKFRTGSLLVDLGDGDRVHIEGFDQIDPAATQVFGAIQFADGTRMSYAEVLAQGFDIDGTEDSDDAHDQTHPQLVGTGVTDRIHGLGGDDVLFGIAGDDVLEGDAGDDQLQGGEGADLLEGGNGADLLFGENGADTLAGGAGSDTLVGGAGDDLYRIARGDGQELVVDEDATAGNSDRVEFAADIAPADVLPSRNGNDLVLTLAASSDSVTVAQHFENDGVTPYSIESIRFASDGTAWDVGFVKQLLTTGTPGNDSITGFSGDDFLDGLAGSDTLSGLGGNDTLSGGAGYDWLDGGPGSDTFNYAAGDGSDTIADTGGAADADALRLAAGIAPGDVTLRRDRLANLDDLYLALSGSGATIRIAGQFGPDETALNGVERIEFDGGTAWDRAAIRLQTLAPTAGADELIGFPEGDSIGGGAGNDLIEGAAGNDTLRGGPGDDSLAGGLGDDTIHFDLGDGQDAVTDKYGAAGFPGDGSDALIFGTGILPAYVTVSRPSGNELRIQINGTNDAARLTQYFSDDALERIQFADGTVWTPATVAAMFPVTGTAGNDTLNGSGLPDTINALAGNDSVRGGGGNDSIDGGTGYDKLYGDGGDDILHGGAADTGRKAASDMLNGGWGNDVLISGVANGQYLYGEDGNDIYIGGSGWAWMEDTAGNNVFVGGSAADNLNLGDGNDLAIGGRGGDSIDADWEHDLNRGRDVVLYNKGDGADIVYGLPASSTLSIGGGALYSNLSFEVFAETLTLKIGTGSIELYGWYAAEPWINQKVANLQIVIEGGKNYAPASTDPMRNRKIQCFDFTALVGAFDDARAAGKTFNVANNLSRFRLWGSDADAIGGALAYQYARTGSLGTLSYAQMRSVVDDPAFGSAAQPIAAPAGATATAERVALQDASVTGEPMTLASAGGNSATAEDPPPVPPNAALSTRQRLVGAGELPEAWFAPQAMPDRAIAHAAAWRRVARELPAHLENSAAWDGAPPFANGVRINSSSAIGVRVKFDDGVGVSDASAGRLRQFEGLKEGLALLA